MSDPRLDRAAKAAAGAPKKSEPAAAPSPEKTAPARPGNFAQRQAFSAALEAGKAALDQFRRLVETVRLHRFEWEPRKSALPRLGWSRVLRP